MTNTNFIKTLTAGVALALAIYPQAWAEIKSYSDCDGKCTVYYNTETQDVTVKPNPGETGDIILGESYRNQMANQGFNVINNFTIEEGITGTSYLSFWNQSSGYKPFTTGNENSVLKLPNSMKSLGWFGIYGVSFGTVELNGSTLQSCSNSCLAVTGLRNLILTPSENLVFGSDAFIVSGGESHDFTVQCRGAENLCRKMMRNVINTSANEGKTISFEYYVGRDKYGNITEEWGPSGVTKYTYSYDGAGNITAAYKDGVSTYKRISYTPAEAAKAVKKGNHNRVTLTFK